MYALKIQFLAHHGRESDISEYSIWMCEQHLAILLYQLLCSRGTVRAYERCCSIRHQVPGTNNPGSFTTQHVKDKNWYMYVTAHNDIRTKYLHTTHVHSIQKKKKKNHREKLSQYKGTGQYAKSPLPRLTSQNKGMEKGQRLDGLSHTYRQTLRSSQAPHSVSRRPDPWLV